MKDFDYYTLKPVFEEDLRDEFSIFRISKDGKKIIISDEFGSTQSKNPEIITDAFNEIRKYPNSKKYTEYKDTILEAVIIISGYKCIIGPFVINYKHEKIVIYWNKDLTFRGFEILKIRDEESSFYEE